ncbi:hypothetical protein NHP190009_04930 [Helicobacter ailurogastricus]|nr:hypothetical protein NHP190009_04930 [Helicobacter ailurogastricus]
MPKHPLEKLLQEHCPDGVEFVALGEVCSIKTGERIAIKEMQADAPYPVWGGGTQPTGNYHAYNFQHAITIARVGSAGHVGFQASKFWATDLCFALQIKDNMPALTKFVFYALQKKQTNIKSRANASSLPNITMGRVSALKIPLPPLVVQEKIVTILDCFTELTARKNNILIISMPF